MSIRLVPALILASLVAAPNPSPSQGTGDPAGATPPAGLLAPEPGR